MIDEPSSNDDSRATGLVITIGLVSNNDDNSNALPRFRTPLFEECLCVLVLLGGCLRCWQANECLWLDELHTSWVVFASPAEIIPRAQEGNQSPLYFYIVWGVVQVFGHSPWTLRLPSLLAGIGLIVGSAFLVRRWTRSGAAGLLVAMMIALNRDCIFYAQEARPYALLQLCALCHAAVFMNLLNQPTRRNRILYVAGAAGLFYLHYTAALYLLAQVVCWCFLSCRPSSRPNYRFAQAATDWAIILLLCVPTLSHVAAVAARRDNWQRMVSTWPFHYALQTTLVLFAAIPLLSIVLGFGLRLVRREARIGGSCWTWSICWWAIPMSLAAAATFSQLAALFTVRYLVTAIVGAMVFAALCAAVFRSRLYRIIYATVIIGGMLASNGLIEQMSLDGRVIGDRNEHWDDMASWLNERLERSPRPVFLCAGLLEDTALETAPSDQLADYCLFPIQGIYTIQSEDLEPLPTKWNVTLTERQGRLVASQGGAWLILRAGPRTTVAISESLERDLLKYGTRLRAGKPRRFGQLFVVRIGR